MKTDIHPSDYRTVLFYDSGAKQGWLINSCAPTSKTMKWEAGKEYDCFMLETSSASHPAYTGKQRTYSNEGRATKFAARYGNMMSKFAK